MSRLVEFTSDVFVWVGGWVAAVVRGRAVIPLFLKQTAIKD